LKVAQVGLRAAGAREGELFRRVLGDEVADAVFKVERLLNSFFSPLVEVPLPHLWQAALAKQALQQRMLHLDLHQGPASLPLHAERLMRYAAATFGAEMLAGLFEGASLSGAAEAWAVKREGGSSGDAAIACAGIDGEVQVLEFEQSRADIFMPGYLVTVDKSLGCVVVALRGTASISDVLADLVCQPIRIALGGEDGLAHDGMLRAAERLSATLERLVRSGLEMLAYEGRVAGIPMVWVCGHSLGAGVAALLTALWRDRDCFPGVQVGCVAFACPQVLDAKLSFAMSNHTTSISLDNDLVPRLSLATAIELREALLRLHSPQEYSLPSSCAAAEVLAAHARGDADLLLEVDAKIKASTATASTLAGRLFPSGRLIHLTPDRRPQEVDADFFGELLIDKDMAAAHMPQRYFAALKAAGDQPA